MTATEEEWAALGSMVEGARELPPWMAPGFARLHAARMGATGLTVWLQDFAQAILVALSDEAASASVGGTVAIDASLAGKAFTTARTVQVPAEGEVRLFVPLLDGADRLGVVEIACQPDAAVPAARWERFAAILADLLVAKGAHTDVYFQARRRQDMTVAAEMQWHLLPPLTVLDPRIELAGLVEPAYEVGGDVFDYAINHDTAHVAIFDAMGHGLDASVMASVAVGTYRHARRNGVPVGDMYTLIDAAFAAQFSPDRFVTAQLAQLHLPSGSLRFINAGHPSPLHVRANRVLGQIDGPRTLPVGMGGAAPGAIVTQLEPGDGLLFFSDGVTEARRAGQAYGLEALVSDLEHVLGRGYPTAEVVRQLNRRLFDWRGGPPGDDATLVLFDWRSPHLPDLASFVSDRAGSEPSVG